eukprot:TRINITY_DN41977_c0_g1_i1.p1 TRINITY_DN41977_c0_g1~~TRINITY_DN41977_c0_g1_i1.p1  ORF type:complete len:771 (-),score=237.07 TRINITY_DN41977_c0_g1_i1:665-2977(-)
MSSRLVFEVECPTQWGEKVGVCGSASCLGNWDAAKALVLEATKYPIWGGTIELETADWMRNPVELKYVVVRPKDDGTVELVRWESDGANRRIENWAAANKVTVFDHFGDLQKSSTAYETVPEEAEAARREASDPTPGASPKKVSFEEGDKAERPSILGSLDVKPSVRFRRLVRSKSGMSFQAQYAVDEQLILGTGMSGGVVVAFNKETGDEVAVKTLPTNDMNDTQRTQLWHEVQNQLTMDHPNICRLLQVYEEPGRLRLVMEKLHGQDLFEHFHSRGKYSEKDAVRCVRQICSAVAYCHSKGVCHRDLKLENFCFEDDSDDGRVKMIDFGLSAQITETTMTDAVGTLYYVAPEVLRQRYDERCDMWSLGVITYVLLTGKPPFAGNTDRETFLKIRKGAFSMPKGRISEHAADFLKKLLIVDPSQRMDAKAALAHPWLTSETSEQEDKADDGELDESVLKGMRAFCRSNALKRALLGAIAPAANLDDVTKWADVFQDLDKDGDGTVGVTDLVDRLRSQLSEAEAEQLSKSLVGVDGDGESVSWSTFLAACLSQHIRTFKEKELQMFFQKMDKDKSGLVSLEDLNNSLGDVMDFEDLKEELDGRTELSYEDFRLFVLFPGRGVKRLIKSGSILGSDWKSYTIKGKCATDFDEVVDTARRENASWRLWMRDGSGLSDGADSRSGSKEATTQEELSPFSPEDAEATSLGLVQEVKKDPNNTWTVSTAEAKDGSVDAIRKENMAWRMIHKEQVDAQRKCAAEGGGESGGYSKAD